MKLSHSSAWSYCTLNGFGNLIESVYMYIRFCLRDLEKLSPEYEEGNHDSVTGNEANVINKNMLRRGRSYFQDAVPDTRQNFYGRFDLELEHQQNWLELEHVQFILNDSQYGLHILDVIYFTIVQILSAETSFY